MNKPFYITTTLPYVNAKPHMGHALEFVRADVIARFKKYQGYDVFFNTGTDEHGAKLYESALEEGMAPINYVSRNREEFKKLFPLLGISPDIHHIATTESRHIESAQKMWNMCNANGYIYKKMYQSKYCVGCELEKQDSELTDGKCPDHPNRTIEFREEENYFFAFSKFQEALLEKYKDQTIKIFPEVRRNEMISFVSSGLQDFSISRLKSKMPWGVPVPGDENHVMYVWFDALTSYISTLGWSDTDAINGGAFEKYWTNGTPHQYCGKDNTRQQCAIWQAMLLASGLSNSNTIIINGFVTGEGGVKMSKSIGNVVDPVEIVSMYGTDALRVYVLGGISTFEDSPCSIALFREFYIAWLQNGVGNLSSRILKMMENAEVSLPAEITHLSIDVSSFLGAYDHVRAIGVVLDRVSSLDRYIQDTQAFKVIKTNQEEGVRLINEYAIRLRQIAVDLSFAAPETSTKILESLTHGVSMEAPLFPRL